MRIIWFLFFITFSFGVIRKCTADTEDDRYDTIVDTKVVEYDDNDEREDEKPSRKDRPRMIRNFVGTNLFGETGARKKCFSAEDIALLAARRDFESLIPKDLPNCLLDDELAKLLMQYFYGANQVIEKMMCGHSKNLAQRAFYDTMGGYLKYYMIPIARYSFYGGLVKLRTVDNIMELYTQCRDSLNTNGNGWIAPLTDFNDLDIAIEPIRIVVPNEEEDQSCTQLDLLDETSGEDEQMIVALPRLDPEEKGTLGNIWLPFRRKRTFDLQSYMSAFVLLRYFELATKCYNFQGICQDTFNKHLKEWILENLEIHLGDDILYPGLGAVLRIIETVRRSSKESIIVVSKTDSKRQKSQKYASNEHDAAQSSGPPSDIWYKDVFGNKKNDQMNVGNLYAEILAKKRRLKYIYFAIGVVIVLLIIVLIGILLALRKRFRDKSGPTSTTKDPESPDGEGEGEGEDKKPLVGKKKSKKKSKKDDDVAKVSPPTSKSCFGLCKKKDSPAIIETSSMDVDAGGNGNKKRDKAEAAKSKLTKNVTVDEKKRYGAPKKSKFKSKDVDEKRSLIPKDLPDCLLDDEIARILMQYLFAANQVIDKMAGGHSKMFAQKAFYDTMGGYLKYYMVPISRYSFYAGLVKLKTVENIMDLYDECKKAINTNGNGWRAPITDFSDLQTQVEPLTIIIREDEEDTSCSQLELADEHSGEADDMIVTLPRLDPEERGMLGNIWLPFKRKRTFNLKSSMSAFVLLRYYELTTRCFCYQGVTQDMFNKKFKDWILENIEIHTADDILYPGLGAILRIIETLRQKTKRVILNTKTDTKRHKTQSYKVLEDHAKKMHKDSPEWSEDVFEPKEEDGFNDVELDKDDNQWLYIYIAITVTLLLLVLIIILALILKQRRKSKPRRSSRSYDICPGRRRTKGDDEEVLLSADSSSIASSNKSKSSTSVFGCFHKKQRKHRRSSGDKRRSLPSNTERDSLSNQNTLAKRESLTQQIESKTEPPEKSDDPPKTSKKNDTETSSSTPRSPKCFVLCAKKNHPDKTAPLPDPDPPNETKNAPEETPTVTKQPATPSAPRSRLGTVNEKKRFSISKKNKKTDEETRASLLTEATTSKEKTDTQQ